MIDNNAVDALEELVIEALETEDCCIECAASVVVANLLQHKDLLGLAVLINEYNKGQNGLEQC
jgi:hypothetical protein